jgi:hypothetical protein
VSEKIISKEEVSIIKSVPNKTKLQGFGFDRLQRQDSFSKRKCFSVALLWGLGLFISRQLVMSEKPRKTSNLASAVKFENDTKSLLPTPKRHCPSHHHVGGIWCVSSRSCDDWILEDFHASFLQRAARNRTSTHTIVKESLGKQESLVKQGIHRGTRDVVTMNGAWCAES